MAYAHCALTHSLAAQARYDYVTINSKLSKIWLKGKCICWLPLCCCFCAFCQDFHNLLVPCHLFVKLSIILSLAKILSKRSNQTKYNFGKLFSLVLFSDHLISRYENGWLLTMIFFLHRWNIVTTVVFNCSQLYYQLSNKFLTFERVLSYWKIPYQKIGIELEGLPKKTLVLNLFFCSDSMHRIFKILVAPRVIYIMGKRLEEVDAH